MKRRAYDAGRLASELAGLPRLNRKQLIERWRELYGSEPFHAVSQQFMIRAIAYKLQENMLGGHDASTLRFLAKAAEELSNGRRMIAKPSSLTKPGTRLLREWHGVTYEAIVLEDGVRFQGKQYNSLSEVARAITGTAWSGPLFFGLKKKET